MSNPRANTKESLLSLVSVLKRENEALKFRVLILEQDNTEMHTTLDKVKDANEALGKFFVAQEKEKSNDYY